MSNNNALTGMTGGLTRPHNPQPISLDSGIALPKRQAPAVLAPSVKVSLSEDVTGEQSKGQRLTEKFEQSSRELLSHQKKNEEDNGELIDGETGVVILQPLELPNKKDLEAFEDLFSNELAKAGVDTSIPIKLTSNGEGGVIVTNDHPDKDKIEAMFASNPDLQQGFVKAETYTTLQKIYQLHQQWMQNIENGMSEESANNWLVNASNNAVDNSELSFNKGKVAQPTLARSLLS